MTIVLFYILALLAEIAGTIGGFGSSIFLIPIAGFFFDFKTVLAITAVLHVFSNVIKISLFNKGVNLRLVLLIGIPSVVFVFLGSVLTNYLNLVYAEVTLGIFLIVFSVVMYIKPLFKLAPTPINAVAGGSVAGFLAGLVGTGGAIRGLCLAAFDIQKTAFIATSAVIDLGVDLTRTTVYLSNDYLSRTYYYLIPILFVIALLGSYIGKKLLEKISQERFKKIVLILIFVVGITMVIKYLQVVK